VNEYKLWIGGRRVDGSTRTVIRVPYDGQPFAQVHLAGERELNAAVEAAAAAAPRMRALTLDERSAILRRASALVDERRQAFAEAISSESGKPLREAQVETARAVSTLLFSSEEAHRLAGEVVPMEASAAGKGRWGMTVREPLGVIAAITPFNFPLNLSAHKLGPAIAGGNAVVHKPASATPISAHLLAAALHDAGLPEGGLNVVAGPGGLLGDLLTTHPQVQMVTFTGSAEVGLRIRARAGLRRVTLELGSNSALIVEPDADLADCVARAVPGSFAHSGQVCISVQRIFVAREVHAEFVERFRHAAAALRLGHPLDPSTEVSSLITESEARRVEAWIAAAESAGARRAAGGARQGASMTPAVLTAVPEECDLFAKEAFGPVAGINAYERLEEAIAAVNRSEYGLQAGIFTRDLERAFRAASQVHVGGFLINDVPQFRVDQMPYGGVKLSGTGREGPRYAIQEMTEPKLITWRV
jgi:acyl-CoA reductase-like NAD-dependent aldehyde dehydrogenase